MVLLAPLALSSVWISELLQRAAAGETPDQHSALRLQVVLGKRFQFRSLLVLLVFLLSLTSPLRGFLLKWSIVLLKPFFLIAPSRGFLLRGFMALLKHP